MNADCTVLVTSCDAYRDVEAPFLKFFRKYWPDCPFELVVNGETAAEPGFDREILSGRGKTWSQMLVEALDQIDTPYVILLMNDYYLESKVDTPRMLALLDVAKSADVLNLRLCPDPPGAHPFHCSAVPPFRLSTAIKNTAYSVSCKVGIWNRLFLHDLAAKTKSAWEFERYGSFMFDEADPRPLLVTQTLEFPFLDVVHKGYWEPWGVELLKREGVIYDFAVRGTPPLSVRIKEKLKSIVFNLSPELVTRVQNVFNAGMK